MAYKKSKVVIVSPLGVPVRERTERACDQCRRRKTKCDGASHCKACIQIGLDCSYGQKIKQARGPQYVAHLESRLKTLENEHEHRITLAGWKTSGGRDALDHTSALSGQQSPEIYSPTSSSSYSNGSGMFAYRNITKSPTGHLESKFEEQQLKRKFADDGVESPHQRQRSASDILTDAKTILDQLSPTNCTARYAAECIQSLSENLYQYNPASQPPYDFTLFESDNDYTRELHAKPDSLNSRHLTTDANIHTAHRFATPDSQLWPNDEYQNHFSARAW